MPMGALNLFHIAAAFAVQYATGVVVQQWSAREADIIPPSPIRPPVLLISRFRLPRGSGLRGRGISSGVRRFAARVCPKHSRPPRPLAVWFPADGSMSITAPVGWRRCRATRPISRCSSLRPGALWNARHFSA